MALLQPRKTLLLKTANKIWAGYYFGLGACALFGASSWLSSWGTNLFWEDEQTSFEVDLFFFLSAFPKHQSPGGH